MSGKIFDWLLATALLRIVSAQAQRAQPGNAQALKEMELAAKAFGVQLQYLDVLGPKDIGTAFRAAGKGRADAVLILLAGLVATSERPQIPDLAVKSRLPAIYDRPEAMEYGGLMSYGVSTADLDRRAVRVGLLLTRGVARDLELKEIRPAAVALKLKLDEIETEPDAKGLASAFQTAKQKQVNAILMIPTRPFFAERKRIVELAGKHRLPAIYPQKEFVDEGGLMSYGADFDDLYRRAAVYVDKILKGAKPADLPVQQATKFEFVINLKAAKQIGLTIPPRVLERANQVIK
jgi:ABC-type uncharacterized transport system substrate-binding protein